MAELKYTIPSDKVTEYISDYVYVHKNTEQIDDPEWVDSEDGTKAPKVNKYTDVEWAREHILRYIKFQIVRGKRAKAQAAINAGNAEDVT